MNEIERKAYQKETLKTLLKFGIIKKIETKPRLKFQS